MKKIQITAKNVQKAIEQGLKELNASQEDVDIKILDEGGFFRKAKIELILEKEDEISTNKEQNVDNVLEEVAKENNKKQEKKESKKENMQETNAEEKVNVSSHEENQEKTIKIAKEFLKNLFEKMNIEATVEETVTDMGINFNANGQNVNNLIGKRGETLKAIQEILLNVIKNNGIKDVKVFFDVENYKNRREMSLINLAERMAKKAIKIEKPIKLEKMNAYERKIIHTALQNMEGITTKSEGEEPNRHLIIIPNKK